MKLDQLIEFMMKNIFFEKSCTKSSRETSPRPFSEKWKYLWINSLKYYTICFNCMASWGLSKYVETKMQTTFFHLILNSFFFKKKRGLQVVCLSHFPHSFWKEIFRFLCSINWPNFIVWLLLLCEILDNMSIVIVCKPGLRPHEFRS